LAKYGKYILHDTISQHIDIILLFNPQNRDLLYELTSVGDLPLPLPQPEENMRNKRAQDTQGDQEEVEIDSIMFTSSNLSELRSFPSAASSNPSTTGPLANGLSDGMSQPRDAVNVDLNSSDFPILDFTQITPAMYSGEASGSGVFLNGVSSAPYQGNRPEQGQQERHASPFNAYSFAGIPEHPAENDANGIDSSNASILTGYQHPDTNLSDTDLIDLWLNAPSGFQSVYFQSRDTSCLN
jgi:hypothetical protein